MFLSWVGKMMGVTYGSNESLATWNQETIYLNSYFNYRSDGSSISDLSNLEIQSRFCDTVFSSISSGSPVLISSKQAGNDSRSHSFLIDQYKIYVYEYVITYVFDPYHNITEDDMLNYPAWCFDWPGPVYGYDPDKDTAELEVVINGLEYMYVRMNWGWNPYIGSAQSINDVYYLLRSKEHYIGEAGTTMDYEQVYLTWTPIFNGDTYSGVEHWAHHFSKK